MHAVAAYLHEAGCNVLDSQQFGDRIAGRSDIHLRVDHSDSPEDLAAIGRDAEQAVLARAARWHAEHRLLLHGRRTVIFR